jgi:glyoxylase-like metal-dependent hydrolase (beta-lactamase superfamily II)
MKPIALQAIAALVGLMATTLAIAASVRPPTPTGWFHVYALDDHTYALSEPKYWQQNVSYLLIGKRRALLFDTGPGIYSIREQVKQVTSLPIVAIPTHLHFDHVGDLPEFTDVRLMDIPGMRSEVRQGYFVESQDQYQLRTPFKVRVHGWLHDGQAIDLGGRTVRIVRTPGHTPDSLSVVDEGGRRLFIGDLANRMATLYAVPGSDVKDAAASLQHLLRLGSADAQAYEAHAEAPVTHAELEQLSAGISRIAANQSPFTQICMGGTPMRRYVVADFPILLPVPGAKMQPPLGSVTEELNFDGIPCD